MTYAQFGRLLERESDCINNIDTIICDEAHNMVKYANRYDNYLKQQQTYTNVIETLKSQVDHKLIVFFTATPNALVNTSRFDNVSCNCYDFRNYLGIKKLNQANTLYFNHYMSLINKVADYDGFKKGYKAVIYTERIDTINKMEKELQKRGLSACGIWSIHNEEWKMSDESLKARDSIIMSGRIPDNIDVLIINASYETGINIYDERVEFVAINSKNTDSCDQGRGRIRKDIDVLYLLDPDAKEIEPIEIDRKWLNRVLLTDDKKLLAQELQIYDEKGRLQQWSSIQGKLVESGYTISNENKRINGKMTRYSFITYA